MNGQTRYGIYSDFEDSGDDWLGKIPRHWSSRKLKFVADSFASNVDKKTKSGETPIKLCNYTDVYYNDEVMPGMPYMSATATEEQIAKFTLCAGDTVITKDSEGPDDIAIPTFVPQDMTGVVCGYHLAIVRPAAPISPSFLNKIFQCSFARSYFSTKANGLTRYGLGGHALASLLLPVPSREEQTQIAKFLDYETAKIDALIEKQQQLIALLQEKCQAVINHAVTKGLNPDAPMRDSGVEWLGEVPAHWETLRLAVLYSESSARAISLQELQFPILSVSIHQGISDRELDANELDRKVTRSEDRSLYKTVFENDLAYNMMRAWQGGFGAATLNGLVSPAYVVCKPKVDLGSRYFELILRTPSSIVNLKRFSRGITDFRLRLYWDDFKNIRVPVPPRKEMDKIIEHTDRILGKYDYLKDAAAAQIELLQERRTALISAAVTGKIDVCGWKPPKTETEPTEETP